MRRLVRSTPVDPGSQPPESPGEPDPTHVVGCIRGFAADVSRVEPAGIPVGCETPQGGKVHHVASGVRGPLQPDVDTFLIAEDPLMTTCVDHVVPHLRDWREEVRQLIPRRWSEPIDVPRVGRCARWAPSRDEQFRLPGEQVGHGEGVPGASSPPQRRGAHDGEAQGDGREGVCHHYPAGVVQNKVPCGRQVSQCLINLGGTDTELRGQLGGAGCPALMGEARIDRHPHVFNVHDTTIPSSSGRAGHDRSCRRSRAVRFRARDAPSCGLSIDPMATVAEPPRFPPDRPAGDRPNAPETADLCESNKTRRSEGHR